MPIFEVKKDEVSRMVKADRRNQVESYVLQDFTISKCDAERAAELAGNGVKVEDVK